MNLAKHSFQFLCGALVVCSMIVQGGAAFGQSFTITQPNITTCSGFIYDSGGTAGTGYGNNEDFVTTICPDQPGEHISLNFLLFSLSEAGAAPIDRLTIYDGNTMFFSAIGEFTGSQLHGLVVTASATNGPGCLTLRFRSNATGIGNFVASISCGLPCAQPTALLNAPSASPVTLCQGGSLLLDGSASLPMPDRTITTWVWRNSGVYVDTTYVPQYDLQAIQSGVQSITLQVIDDQGCPSAATDAFDILVGTTPVLSASASATVVCPGNGVELVGAAQATPLVSIGAACQVTGTGMQLPDNLGIPFTTAISMGASPPGAVLTDLAQLGDICLNIQHSYVGDLLVTLTCPNGQSVDLHQQGGGPANLGIPSMFPNPWTGACWNYCFSDQPQYGTWAASGMGGGTSLPPGSYASAQPLDQLLGCPMNGTWTLTFIDLWSSDDGRLCEWCMGFGNAPDSSYIAVGPIPGSSPDSSFWSGTGVTNDPVDGGQASALLQAAGTFPFTYTVIDSYGCTYSTTVMVEAVSPLDLDAGADIVLCEGAVTIGAQVLDGLVPETCTYTLRLFDSAGNGWTSGIFEIQARVNITIDGQTSTYSMNFGSFIEFSIAVTPGASLSVQYVVGSNNAENSFLLLDDLGMEVYASPVGPAAGLHYSGTVTCNGGISATQFSWSPEEGLSDPTILNPEVFTMTSRWYHLTAMVPSEPPCMAMDSVWVEAPDSGILTFDWDEGDATLCADPGFDEYRWYLAGSLEHTTTSSCLEDVPYGFWRVIAIPPQGCAWSSPDSLLCPSISIVQDAGSLFTQPGLGTYAWTYLGNAVPGVSGPFLELLGSGEYTVTLTTSYGCVVTASIVVIGLGADDLGARDRAWTIHPNPTDGRFSVSIGDVGQYVVELSIVDLAGRAVLPWKVHPIAGGMLTLDHQFAPGTYLVQLRMDGRTEARRLVVR
jgi:hypothetical protein